MTNKPMLSVPLEPTIEMIEALAGVVSEMFGIDDCEDGFRAAYAAMIAAAPAAQKQVEPSHWADPAGNTITAKLKAYNLNLGGAPSAATAHYANPLYAEQPAPVAVVMPEFESAFEAWWESDGQYCRAGGGSYEKTFAYRAYEAALAEVTRLNTPQ